MRANRVIAGSVLAVMVVGAAPWAVAQPPPYELRTYVIDPAGIAGNDVTRQYGMSKLRGAYVCPYCGYSANVPGNCPNPFGVPNPPHPANAALVRVSLVDRLLTLVTPFGNGTPPPCDIQYRNTANPGGGETWDTPNEFRAVVGRPFHPMRTGGSPGDGNLVYATWAWPGAPTNVRVHFLTLPPGVREPYAYRSGFQNATYGDVPGPPTPPPTPPAWAQNTHYRINQWVTHNGQTYRCIRNHNSANGNQSEPGAGNHWNMFWVWATQPAPQNQAAIGASECGFEFCSQRAAHGDEYTVRQYVCLRQEVVNTWFDPLTLELWATYRHWTFWRMQVYSKLYGCEFDTGAYMAQGNDVDALVTNPPREYENFAWPVQAPPLDAAGSNFLPPAGNPPNFRIVVASGAVRIRLPLRWQDNNPWCVYDPGTNTFTTNDTNACWEVRFTVGNTGRMSPEPPNAPDRVTNPAPTAFYLYDAPAVPGDEGFEWSPYTGAYFTFNGNVVRNNDTVHGNWGGSPAPGPGVPPALAPGEVGQGRVIVQWYLPENDATGPLQPGPQRFNWVDLTPSPPDNVARNYYVSEGVGNNNSFGEWWYSDSDRNPATPEGPTNAELAQANPPVNFTSEYAPIESRFLSSPYQVPKADPGRTDRHGVAIEPSPSAADGYARVLIGPLTGGGVRDDLALPGCATVRRAFRLNNLLTQGDVYYRCPLSGAIFTTPVDAGLYPAVDPQGYGVSPFFGPHTNNVPPYDAPGPLVQLQRIVPEGRRLAYQVLQSLMVPEVALVGGNAENPWSATLPNFRPRLPDEALQIGPFGCVVPLGSANSTGTGLWVSAKIPPHQPASEPGEAPGNTMERNWGYRGMMALYQPTLDVSDPNGAASPYDDNGRWDAFFVCPDCGTPYNEAVPAPGTGNVLQCRNPACPGHTWCRVCGCVYPAGFNNCPLDGSALQVVRPQPNGNGDNNFGFGSIAAESFDALDLQVSVAKRTELRASMDSPDMGRVAPGVTPTLPDDTAGDISATPRRADPSNVSAWGTLAVRNEGNTIPDVLGVSPLAGNALADAWWRLFRPEADQWNRSYGWAGAHNPVAQGLRRAYYDDTSLAYLVLQPNPADPWRPVNPPGGQAAGTVAGAVLQTGDPATPIGTGQVLGRYSGPQVYFLDQNGNGLFDFRRGGNPMTSAQGLFDPSRDEALEPFTVVEPRVRVSESRLPYDDYFARDTAPTPRFDYGADGEPIRLQVIWMTDRNVGNRQPGAPVPPTRDPADAPPANSPLNLVYANASAVGSGEMRNYVWTSPHPIALTTSTLANNPLAQNGPADTYASGTGPNATVVGIWHATQRMGGGLKSEVRTTATNAAAGTWPGGSFSLWTGQERAEGVRGFYASIHDVSAPIDRRFTEFPNPDPTQVGHWVMWHSGQRGQERIMFRTTVVDTSGGAPVVRSIGGLLPLDNAVAPGDRSTTVATLHDEDGLGPEVATPVTLQKFPHGPFTAVKDVSAFYYLPPLIYDTTNGGSATQPQIRVFFAGYARDLKNFDIYEARFNRADLLTGANNRGKIEFPRTPWRDDQGSTEGMPPTNPTAIANGDFASGPGEEFTADPLRREFHSLHIDWSTSTNFLNGGGTGDANFVLGVKLQGVVPNVHYYSVQWGPANAARGDRYDAKQGVYNVIPRFPRLDVQFLDIPTPPAGPLGAVQALELVDPTTRSLPEGPRPLRMEIDPTLGVVRFSAPLFNTLNPSDESCVFNTRVIPQLVDVFLCGSYSPFLKRLTTSPADDDCPTAIMESGPWDGNDLANGGFGAPEVQVRPWPLHATNQNLMLFWRRTFSPGQAPYHGRTCYMMKRWSWTVRVNHPPITGPKTSVVVSIPGAENPQLFGPGMPREVLGPLPDYPNLQNRNEYDVDITNGVVAVWPGVYRWVTSPNGNQHHRAPVGAGSSISVTYTPLGATAPVTETHQIGGWSQETVVPIDTVLAEGPLRVAEETYTVPWSPGAAPNEPRLVARRYWVFWTSPRPVYDLRAENDNGAEPRQSSSIYYCAIAPEFPTLIRERRASSYSPDPFLP